MKEQYAAEKITFRYEETNRSLRKWAMRGSKAVMLLLTRRSRWSRYLKTISATSLYRDIMNSPVFLTKSSLLQIPTFEHMKGREYGCTMHNPTLEVLLLQAVIHVYFQHLHFFRDHLGLLQTYGNTYRWEEKSANSKWWKSLIIKPSTLIS